MYSMRGIYGDANQFLNYLGRHPSLGTVVSSSSHIRQTIDPFERLEVQQHVWSDTDANHSSPMLLSQHRGLAEVTPTARGLFLMSLPARRQDEAGLRFARTNPKPASSQGPWG